MTVRWFPEMDNALRKGVEAKVGFEQIGERIGVAAETAKRRAQVLDLKINSRPRGKAWSDSEVQTLFEMRKQGKSPSQIADTVGRSYYAVLGKAHRLGLGEQG